MDAHIPGAITCRQLATTGRDGTSRLYALPLEDIVAIAKTRVTREMTCQERRTYLHEEVSCP